MTKMKKRLRHNREMLLLDIFNIREYIFLGVSGNVVLYKLYKEYEEGVLN